MREFFSKPAVIFWGIFVILFFTLPGMTFLCDNAVGFTPFIVIEIVRTIALHTDVLPDMCRNTVSVFDLVIHLVLLTALLSHLLMILTVHFTPKSEEPYLSCSTDYLLLVIKTLIEATVISVAVGAFITWALKTPEIQGWLWTYTTLRSPAQTIVLITLIIWILSIVVAALYEERFSFWDGLFFCIEMFVMIYEVTFIITGIDLVLVILSLPFPAFTQDFNPFFPPLWQTWYKEFN